jgi:hypothetical protein
MAPTSTFTPTSRLLRKREAARIRQRRCRQRKREAAFTTTTTDHKNSSVDDHSATSSSTSTSTSSISKITKIKDGLKHVMNKKLFRSSNKGSYDRFQATKFPTQEELHRPRPVLSSANHYTNSTVPASHQMASQYPVSYPGQQQASYYRPSSWEHYNNNPPPHHPTMRGGGNVQIHYGHPQATHPSYHHQLPAMHHPHGGHHPHHPSSSYGVPPPPPHMPVAGPPSHPMSSSSSLNNGVRHHPHHPYSGPGPFMQVAAHHAPPAPATNTNHNNYMQPFYSAFPESTRTISRSPSASSLETPVTKKVSSSSSTTSNSSSNNCTVNNNSSMEEYTDVVSDLNTFRSSSSYTKRNITETDVKRKVSKSLLSTEKAAVFAMLTLKNNSSDDSDESTVTSHETNALFTNRRRDTNPANDDGGYDETPIQFSLSTVAATTITAV